MKFKIVTSLLLGVSLLLFAFDRILKNIFSTIGGEYFVLGDWLKLKLAYNPGIAFGIGLNYWLIIFLYGLILFLLVWYLVRAYQQQDLWEIFLFGLVIAGGFSNLLDRVCLGQVVDYLDLKYYSVFNLADAMIIIGAVGLLIKVYVINRKSLT